MPVKKKEKSNLPVLYNVWLIRTADFPISKFEEVFKLLSSLKGPLDFKKSPEPVSDGQNTKNSHLEAPWDYFFDLATNFRKEDLGDDEFVVVLSNRPNYINWFSGADYGGRRNIFVHTGDWDLIFPDGDESYPIAYHVAITLIHHLWFKSIDEINSTNVHEHPIGCINDFCRQKSQAILKMRTADICPICLKKIMDRGIDMPVVMQVLAILERIRKGMLYKELFQILKTTPTLTVYRNSKFMFEDLNIEIDFGPVGKVGKAIYLFYLNQNEGVSYDALKRGDYFDQLFKIYNRFFRVTEKKGEENQANLSLEVARTTLKNNLNENLSTLVSRINRAFGNELGPALGKDFGITGDRGKERRIMVNREFITYSK